MVEAGMTGIRMNLSHGPLAAHKDWLVMLHKAGVKKLLIDLQGPELRIGRLPQPLSLTAGQTVRLGAQGIPCPAALVQGVQPGQELLDALDTLRDSSRGESMVQAQREYISPKAAADYCDVLESVCAN